MWPCCCQLSLEAGHHARSRHLGRADEAEPLKQPPFLYAADVPLDAQLVQLSNSSCRSWRLLGDGSGWGIKRARTSRMTTLWESKVALN